MSRGVRRVRLAAGAWAGIAGAAEPALRMLLWRRARRGREIAVRLPERRGIAREPRPAGTLFWFHAASVGETQSLLGVLDALDRLAPEVTVLVTTATVTAQALLQQRRGESIAAGRLHARFAPLDVPRWVNRFLDHWRPDLAAFVESELWPNLLRACERRGIPLALLNARLSARSARRWARLSLVAGPVAGFLLGRFGLVAARSEEDAERLRALGVAGVVREGDLKRAAPPLPGDAAELARLEGSLGGRPRWLAASTHPGEEAAVADTHRALSQRYPDLLTVVAPRHPERGAAVAALLGGAPRRADGRDPEPNAGFWVVDTLGELGMVYRLAPAVLLGNSLAEVEGRGGGHNPLEPARLDCALAIGPRHENFHEDVARLRDAGGLVVLPDAAARAEWLARMLDDPLAAGAMAAAARREADGAADLPERIVRRLLALRAGGSC